MNLGWDDQAPLESRESPAAAADPRDMTRARILVTGATGYIGGRLIPRLLDAGYRVRCLVRDPARLDGRPWRDRVEVVAGDVLDAATLPAALEAVDIAYYLVHSMAGGVDFEARDRRAADQFAAAARAAGVTRIVYLGGLGSTDASAPLSDHLRSRQETGDRLRAAGPPVTEFRAGVIVGSGSLSFEMIRYLTERVPVMICPRWVFTRTQPIAVRDVLAYLVAALETPESIGRTFEIGGNGRVTYGDMMLGYAKARGLRRWMLPVPVLTPRLSSYWVHLVTPIPAAIARPLVLGLRNELVAHDAEARRVFPDIVPLDYADAVRAAIARLEAGPLETVWNDALTSSAGAVRPVVLTSEEGMITERRQLAITAPLGRTFRAFTGLGGDRGWLYMNWAWQLRGALDRLCGGVGMRRGRRHPDELRSGEALDFWRVEALDSDRMLRLRAEMKVPGRAWLEFSARTLDDGRTLLSQTAYFAPRGLSGLLYWYLLYPVHALIFSGMIRGVARRAEASGGGG